MSGWCQVTATVTDPATGEQAQVTGACAVSDARVGATIPPAPGQTRLQVRQAFETLTGMPLAAWRAELGGSPMPASLSATFLAGAVPAGCRVLFDLQPAVDGSDLAVLDGFAASCQAAGIDAAFSFWHEPSSVAALTAAQFTSIFPLAAAVIRRYAGPGGPYRSIYCLSGGEIASKGILASYYPGDEWVDVIAPDLYIRSGMAGFALAAPFAAAHGKPLGACEFGIQSSCPTCNNYGTATQNLAYLTSLQAAFTQIAAAGQPVADLCLFQGANAGQGNFSLSANTYALPAFQAVHAAFGTTGNLG